MRKTRVNLAQERLNKIRSHNNMLVSSTPTNRIRLRRMLPTTTLLSRPQNLKVEVVNNTSLLRGPQFKYRRHKQILNHDIQQQIMELQQNSLAETYWIEEVTPVSTNIKMHDRFAQLT
ncbi:unnamed protein product [Acanthoscelides obtectus]|uniref:Uncharacterized protein n=1 Tax=Acanthoscelides obtectus TaxID=200917 RepID=A0A9P0KB92_ACAOB|nr:unnamed protein product [Acanthoscelides obtectus]CAK1653174.1 hypothetical protein AOBTE_LOCUS18104 [Acanthoscelides obtectus]